MIAFPQNGSILGALMQTEGRRHETVMHVQKIEIVKFVFYFKLHLWQPQLATKLR
jgi:hypothetical protein